MSEFYKHGALIPALPGTRAAFAYVDGDGLETIEYKPVIGWMQRWDDVTEEHDEEQKYESIVVPLVWDRDSESAVEIEDVQSTNLVFIDIYHPGEEVTDDDRKREAFEKAKSGAYTVYERTWRRQAREKIFELHAQGVGPRQIADQIKDLPASFKWKTIEEMTAAVESTIKASTEDPKKKSAP